ncbi:MAG TPA: CPBP family intramembrane metalloprotease [bacterium]|nr:CPBP family intramembrane metalloprotease [bacterium]
MNPNYRYKPLTYYAVVFLGTYLFWFIGAYLSYRDESGAYLLLLLLGLMTPFITSLVMILTSKNTALKKDFVDRLVNLKRIQPGTLPVFFLIMPAAILLAIVISLPFGGSTDQFQIAEDFSFSVGAVPSLLLLLVAASLEELGWRGYAFDSLLSRHTFFKASILFSVLWALWHFPLIFVKNTYQYEIFHQNIWYAVNFFAAILPMGVVISWIWMKNNKSILAAILFHLIVNLTNEMFNVTQSTKCIETAVVAVFAALIIWFDRELFFSKAHLMTKNREARS